MEILPSDCAGRIGVCLTLAGRRVYIGGSCGLWMSPDAGRSWKRFESLPFGIAANVTLDPADSSSLYVTTFGGVWHGPSSP